jgi:hypothetical protein
MYYKTREIYSAIIFEKKYEKNGKSIDLWKRKEYHNTTMTILIF